MRDKTLRDLIPCHAEAAGEAMVLRRVSGGLPTDLSNADREQLIVDARAGKLVTVHVEAVTFIQRDAPNRNLTRFRDGVLRSLAPSFAGMPVLRDHEQQDATARAGRILESKLENREGEPGAKQIRMSMELTAPWAVEMALRGLMDRFSIGWHASGDTVCSICGEPMTSGWIFTWTNCEHDIGEEYEGQVCQIEFTDAVGVEVSAVSVPAVVGTGVEDIRAQLSAARAAGAPRKEKRMSSQLSNIAALLGLPADADEGAVAAGVRKLNDEKDGAEAKLADAQRQLADVRGQLEQLAATARKDKAERLIQSALDDGRMLPNSKSEAHARKLAELGYVDALEAFVVDMPRGGAAPLGLPRQSAGADPTPREQPGELTERQKKIADDLGVTHEEYVKTLAAKAGNKGGR